ncbi:MAG: AraC family transcriptional regulator [Clostridia bacterium]|nr:AraC family transcriptional regulator [Clostridia bacterium]
MVSELTEAEDQPVSVEKNILHLLAMPEDLCKHFSQDMSCYPICERDHILLILHRPGLDQGSMQELSAKICHEFAEAHTDRETRLYFGIGSAVEALWDITSSVDSALHAVNKRIIFPDQSVFHDDAGDASDLTFISRLSETESEIERLLLQRNTIELSRVSYQLVDHCRRRFKDSLVAVSYIYVLGSVILGRLSQDSLELTDALSHLISFGSKKRMSVSTAEITDFLMNFFACIIKDLNNSQISYQEKLIAGIRTYIGEQLHDTQLRLESIAAQFHMHPSHLSRLFKKYEKINVSDYITGKRIQWAEKLLLSGIDPISVISEQVGYASPYYFSACFKKLTGKTPSEYRRNP